MVLEKAKCVEHKVVMPCCIGNRYFPIMLKCEVLCPNRLAENITISNLLQGNTFYYNVPDRIVEL